MQRTWERACWPRLTGSSSEPSLEPPGGDTAQLRLTDPPREGKPEAVMKSVTEGWTVETRETFEITVILDYMTQVIIPRCLFYGGTCDFTHAMSIGLGCVVLRYIP